MNNIQVGSIVRLKRNVSYGLLVPEGRQDNRRAAVRALLAAGGVQTEKDLRGCRYWHSDDLELVK